jgi:hypothetical protein
MKIIKNLDEIECKTIIITDLRIILTNIPLIRLIKLIISHKISVITGLTEIKHRIRRFTNPQIPRWYDKRISKSYSKFIKKNNK